MQNKMIVQGIAYFVRNRCKRAAGFAAAALVAVPLAGSFAPLFAQQPGEQTFSSPQDAAHALVAAMKSPDEQPSLQVLGPAAKEVLSSGDPIEDSDARAGFVAKYQQMHRFVKEADGSVTLVVGAENWPFPIPLANNHGSWYFDTDAGRDEILFRRIGGNELAAAMTTYDPDSTWHQAQ
jgi:hypothetical protein